MERAEECLKQWKKPPAEYYGKPFWSWNGDLKEEELLRQIDVMKEMGFGGFFMHSRTGLQTEYLGEDWFRLIKACSAYGKARGMECWLYDEDRWPSGTAGGKVTAKKENRMKFIEMFRSEQYCPHPDDVCAFAVKCKETGIETPRPVRPGDCLEPGEHALQFRIAEMRCTSFYNGNTYLDTMNPSAVQDFLESTHEAYRKNCGEMFGGTITGIFTDEPHRGGLFTDFSEGSPVRVPYTEGLFERFYEKYGTDLKAQLPELFLSREICPVKWQFVELEQELFLKSYMKQIQDWCTKNKLLFTGHLLHEDNFTSQTAMQGSLMRSYFYMDIPGVDVLSEGNRKYWIVKQLTSAARQAGKKWELSELYGCTGWQFNFQSHKEVGDWQALFGINLRCHHLSWYTMVGEAKRDYPASILHQSAWYREYAYVETYFARLGMLLSAGEPECGLLVLNPVESVWARVHSGCFQGLSAKDPAIQRLEKQYAQVFHLLADNHIDFDYGDEGILAEHALVEGDCLRVGKMLYHKVLVTGMDTMRESTFRLLQEFMRNGGRVFLAGEAPKHIDAKPCDTKQFASMSRIEIEEIPQYTGNGTEIKTESSRPVQIFVQSRRLKTGRAIVLTNMDRENAAGKTRVMLGKGGSVAELDARSGEIRAVKPYLENGSLWVETEFAPSQERVFFLFDQAEPKLEVSVPRKYRKTEKFCLKGYTLEEANICVLDIAKVRMLDGAWSEPMEILRADRYVRNKFGLPYRGGEMVQPWYQKKMDSGSQKTYGKTEIAFSFDIVEMPAKGIELVLEQSAAVKVWINGCLLDTSAPAGKWIDICFERFAIPGSFLRQGENEIRLELDFYREYGLEAIYLLGSFGVQLEGTRRKLTALPSRLEYGDITKQGLPFYSGTIVYHGETEETGKKTVRVRLEEMTGACARANERIIAFRPWETETVTGENGELDIAVVLTRRNTFGPLHQLPIKTGSYGPDNFVTEGDRFSMNCQLIPQGLLREPIVEFAEE